MKKANFSKRSFKEAQKINKQTSSTFKNFFCYFSLHFLLNPYRNPMIFLEHRHTVVYVTLLYRFIMVFDVFCLSLSLLRYTPMQNQCSQILLHLSFSSLSCGLQHLIERVRGQLPRQPQVTYNINEP